MSIFAVICFLLSISVLVALGVIDIFKTWRQRKREERRRQQVIDNINVIGCYCFFSGISKGYEMYRSIEDIIQDRLEK